MHKLTESELITYLVGPMSRSFRKLTPWEKRHVRQMVQEWHRPVRWAIEYAMVAHQGISRLYYALADNQAVVAFDRKSDRDAFCQKGARVMRSVDARSHMILRLASLDSFRSADIDILPSVRLYELYHHTFA